MHITSANKNYTFPPLYPWSARVKKIGVCSKLREGWHCRVPLFLPTATAALLHSQEHEDPAGASVAGQREALAKVHALCYPTC